jgi:molybdopterin-guanine dinucleotide biosynthesis protein A
MSTPRPLTGFILAGGKSLRMGRDKAALDWRGRSLLEHMHALLATVCDTVHVVGRNNLPDRLPDLGPLGGISTALHSTATRNNLVVAVDLPFLTRDLLKYVKEHLEDTAFPLVVCQVDSDFPLCLGIRRDLAAALDAYIAAGKRSLQGFIGSTPRKVISGLSRQRFINLNTQADYLAALQNDIKEQEIWPQDAHPLQ